MSVEHCWDPRWTNGLFWWIQLGATWGFFDLKAEGMKFSQKTMWDDLNLCRIRVHKTLDDEGKKSIIWMPVLSTSYVAWLSSQLSTDCMTWQCLSYLPCSYLFAFPSLALWHLDERRKSFLSILEPNNSNAYSWERKLACFDRISTFLLL